MFVVVGINYLNFVAMVSSADDVGNRPMSNPRVGVAAVIVDNGQMVFGKRKGSHGAGEMKHLPWDCGR
jgi:hypothetical protein